MNPEPARIQEHAMATVPRPRNDRPVECPTEDGGPTGETEIHRENRADLVQTLKDHFADGPMVRVSDGLLVFSEAGDAKKRMGPDVFVARGVETPWRDNSLVWEGGKGPDLVIVLTSKSRRRKDKKTFAFYRDVLKITELFLIDPSGGFFDAPLQGLRRSESGPGHVPIQPGRGPGLYSEVLGLNLAREGYRLRLFDPETGRKLLTAREHADEAESMRVQIEKARRLVAAELELADMRRLLTDSNLTITEAQLDLAELQIEQQKAEIQRLRDENAGLRGR